MMGTSYLQPKSSVVVVFELVIDRIVPLDDRARVNIPSIFIAAIAIDCCY